MPGCQGFQAEHCIVSIVSWLFISPVSRVKRRHVSVCMCVFPSSGLPPSVRIVCVQEGYLASVCREWTEQHKVNPVTMCTVHSRQTEAAGSMQEHAHLVSNKARGMKKKGPLILLFLTIMEDNKSAV